MYKVVIVTCKSHPSLQPSDKLLADSLTDAGYQVVARAWNGDSIDWCQFDLILVRSTWDYPAHAQAFSQWLKQFENDRRVINSAGLMMWNMDKKYLLELALKGAVLPDTKLIRISNSSIRKALIELDLSEAVLKPTVGASASGIRRVSLETPVTIELAAEQLAGESYLIQPFLEQITTFGEISLIYVAGSFTHAVIKRAQPGDFRVQAEHGGSTTVMESVPKALIDEGTRILEMLPDTPTYARVDMVSDGNTHLLMEVELIEPELFFNYVPEAIHFFSVGIQNIIQKNQQLKLSVKSGLV